MTAEQAAAGPEGPLLADGFPGGEGDRGGRSSSCRRRRPVIQNQPKRPRLRAKTSQRPSARSRFGPSIAGIPRTGRGERHLGGGDFLGEGVWSECLRALSAGDPGEVGAGPLGPADLPGSGRRRVRPRVPQRAAVRGQAAGTSPCRFAAWSAPRARRPRSISAPEPGSSCPTASGGGRTSFASCCPTAARATARRSIARRPRTSFAAWRMPSGISAACPRSW